MGPDDRRVIAERAGGDAGIDQRAVAFGRDDAGGLRKRELA